MLEDTNEVIRSRKSKRDRQRNYQTFEEIKEVIISRRSKDSQHNGRKLEDTKRIIRRRKSRKDRQI